MILLKFWKPIIFALIIFIGSISSSSELNKIPFLSIPNIDKIIHFMLYFILTVLLFSSMYKTNSTLVSSKKIIALICVFGYGLFLELMQFVVTLDRSAEYLDFISNCLGAICGFFLFPFILKLKISKWL
ncbi:MAG: hypothetical protein A2041_01840 [Bacteroidetes bacterium GWA2_31_9b]|nr:MAG: hypothetical protein A2041_01840 [Bacteroidetes bacterium GWA2_31_9b]